ncbi:MAG: hypothetical protein D6785_06885, partial [Planctomycetota bacterium]
MKKRDTLLLVFLILSLLVTFTAEVQTVYGQDSQDQEIRKYDILILKNNQKFEGKVIQKGDKVVFISKDGKQSLSFPMKEVLKILPANTPLQVYQNRLKNIQKTDSKAHLDLAKFCLKYSLKEEAILELKRAIVADPKNEEAYDILATLLSQKRNSYFALPPKDQKKKEGLALLNEEFAFYHKALKEGIQNGKVLYRLGQIYYLLGLPKKGFEFFSQSEKQDLSQDLDYQENGFLWKARILEGMGKFQDAIDLLKAKDPKDFPFLKKWTYWMVLGRSYYSLQKWSESLKAFEEAKKTLQNPDYNPLKVEASLYLGTLYVLQSKPDLINGEKEFQEALKNLLLGDFQNQLVILSNLVLI